MTRQTVLEKYQVTSFITWEHEILSTNIFNGIKILCWQANNTATVLYWDHVQRGVSLSYRLRKYFPERYPQEICSKILLILAIINPLSASLLRGWRPWGLGWVKIREREGGGEGNWHWYLSLSVIYELSLLSFSGMAEEELPFSIPNSCCK